MERPRQVVQVMEAREALWFSSSENEGQSLEGRLSFCFRRKISLILSFLFSVNFGVSSSVNVF